MKKTALILGGGVGGLVTANVLRREAPDCDIVLIDREREHLFAPSLLWLLIGERQPHQIKRPLSRRGRRARRLEGGFPDPQAAGLPVEVVCPSGPRR